MQRIIKHKREREKNNGKITNSCFIQYLSGILFTDWLFIGNGALVTKSGA
nr:MAG TPA: hypothetical protein [Caudoviricetes sp.]